MPRGVVAQAHRRDWFDRHAEKLTMHRFDRTAIRLTGLISILAALLGSAGDLFLQYTSNSEHLMSRRALYLLDVPPARLLLGHYLGVVGILFEIVGFWAIYRALKP